MSLGNLLLQPQRLQREAADPQVAIAQDLMRLATLLAEDALDDGPLALVLPQAIERLGARVQAQAEGGIAAVYAALKARFQPLFLYFEGLERDLDGLGQDPTALLGIIRQLVAGLRALLDGISQAQIKAQLDFAKALIEQDLGLDQAFVGRQIDALLDDLTALWQGLPADISPLRRRRKRLAIEAVRRLRRHLLDRFTLPEIDTARAASSLYGRLRSTGLRQIFEEIDCVLDRFEEAVAAVGEIAAALPLTGGGGGSVGAALIDPPNATRYCWYASWLLSDIDLPLLGTGDIEDKHQFAVGIRARTNVIPKRRAVAKYIFSTLSLEQQRQVMAYPAGSEEPDDALMLMLTAQINQLMMAGPIYTSERFDTPHPDQSEQDLDAVPFEFRLRADEAFELPEELAEMARDYRDKQSLYLYNRRFLEWVFGELLSELAGGFLRYAGRKTIGIRRDVIVTGDRRYVMCNDIPIHVVASSEEARWQDSRLFIDKGSGRQAVEGATYYRFTRVSGLACDILAQVLFGLEQTGRPIWHLLKLQPGHEIGTAIVSGLDILHALHQLFFFKPISGYETLGGWGRWLANDYYGPRGLALFGGSFQGFHTEATEGNPFWFWITVVAGDFLRIAGHNGILQTIRDFVLTFFTLLNSSASNSGDSSLPSNPAANHLKQAGVVSPMNTLFAYLLMQVYKREDHSIEIWSADGIGDQRARAFGLWFGGSAGFGVLSGLAASIVSQFIAWQEDWKLLGITVGESMLTLFFGYWIFEYLFKEGDTANGTFALTGSYKGYPAHAGAPYRLPYAPGTPLYMGQGNSGLFSHNTISSGSNWQGYAFDFGHDHGQEVRAMRGGVVWDFAEGFADNNENNANFIIIRHDALVDDHDDPRGSGTPQVTFARYLHGAQGGVTAAFGFTPTREMAAPGAGTPVAQGDFIMRADDTGTSFHSHLHIDVYTGTATARGNESIPFVFEDVDGDGLPQARTWYRAGG